MTADQTTTPLMSIVVPVPLVRTGPLYASDLVTAMSRIDGHTHVSGYGAQIPPAGLNLNSDVDFNPAGSTGNNAIGLRTARLVLQSAKPANSSDVRCIYTRASGDLYYIDSAGNDIQLTAAGALNSAALTVSTLSRFATTGNVTIGASDTYVYYDCDTTSGTITITLPAASATSDKFYIIKHSAGSNTIVINRAGSDTIDGATSVTIQANKGAVLLHSNGSAATWGAFKSSHDLNGASVPIAGALTTGNGLYVSGTSALSYSALNLAGGSNYVTGVLPAANVGAPGGDLGGTHAASTVISLTGAAGVIAIATTGNIFTWAAGTTAPGIKHTAAASGAGATMTIWAQDAGTASSAGGRLTLRSGSDLTAGETAAGGIRFMVGALSKLEVVSGGASTTTVRLPALGSAGSGEALQIQSNAANTSGTGGSITLTAGAAAGSNQNGGGVAIVSGAKTGTGIDGGVRLFVNADPLVQAANVASTRRVVALAYATSVSTSEMGTNTGDLCIYIGETSTPPTVSPTSGTGGILYVDAADGRLKFMRRAGNVIDTLG